MFTKTLSELLLSLSELLLSLDNPCFWCASSKMRRGNALLGADHNVSLCDVCVCDGLLGGDHCTHRDDIPIPQLIQNLLVKRPDLKNQNTSVTD